MIHPIIISENGELSKEDSNHGILHRYLSSSAGRQRLAEAALVPLRRNIDYQGIARKALMVEPLPQGAIPNYFPAQDDEITEFKHNQIFINEDGSLRINRAGEVVFPSFEIYSNPTINIKDVQKRRFDLIDRILSKFVHDEIFIEEDGSLKRKEVVRGWSFSEKIGVAVINPRGLRNAKLSSNVSINPNSFYEGIS